MLCRILHPARLCTPSIGRFRSRCGVGVRIRGGVGIRQSGSDFNEGMHNLADFGTTPALGHSAPAVLHVT